MSTPGRGAAASVPSNKKETPSPPPPAPQTPLPHPNHTHRADPHAPRAAVSTSSARARQGRNVGEQGAAADTATLLCKPGRGGVGSAGRRGGGVDASSGWSTVPRGSSVSTAGPPSGRARGGGGRWRGKGVAQRRGGVPREVDGDAPLVVTLTGAARTKKKGARWERACMQRRGGGSRVAPRGERPGERGFCWRGGPTRAADKLPNRLPAGGGRWRAAGPQHNTASADCLSLVCTNAPSSAWDSLLFLFLNAARMRA